MMRWPSCGLAHLARLERLDHAVLLGHAADPFVTLDAHARRLRNGSAIVGSAPCNRPPCNAAERPHFSLRSVPFASSETAMRTATDLLSQYAAYHRDRRNIASHFVGVPMIVFAVGVLLARPTLFWGELALTPAWIACAPRRRVVPDARQPGARRHGQRRGRRVDSAGAPGRRRRRVDLARLGRRRVRARLGDPVRRPLVRRPEAGLRRRPDRPAGRSDVRRRRGAVRARLEQAAAGKRSSDASARRPCATWRRSPSRSPSPAGAENRGLRDHSGSARRSSREMPAATVPAHATRDRRGSRRPSW